LKVNDTPEWLIRKVDRVVAATKVLPRAIDLRIVRTEEAGVILMVRQFYHSMEVARKRFGVGCRWGCNKAWCGFVNWLEIEEV
jgi:hypothetical protein